MSRRTLSPGEKAGVDEILQGIGQRPIGDTANPHASLNLASELGEAELSVFLEGTEDR